ncbi:MAG TPA: hypothetical protein VN611_10920 [Patescibacteria group bacterium]|nr:hypothetical protein [Patescibacteria group bacterium]
MEKEKKEWSQPEVTELVIPQTALVSPPVTLIYNEEIFDSNDV